MSGDLSGSFAPVGKQTRRPHSPLRKQAHDYRLLKYNNRRQSPRSGHFRRGTEKWGKKNKENVERHELYGVDGYAMSTTTLVFFSHGAGNWYLTMGTGCCCRWRSSSWQFSPVGVARWKRTISPSSYPYKDGPALARPSLSLSHGALLVASDKGEEEKLVAARSWRHRSFICLSLALTPRN